MHDVLVQVQLWNKVNVRTFKTDDEDRVRGCYTSHIAVLKEIREKFKNQNNYQVGGAASCTYKALHRSNSFMMLFPSLVLSFHPHRCDLKRGIKLRITY